MSIGLPVFNGENFLRRSIDSLLAQDFPDFELIISDNASTDGTARICQELARSDERVRYYRHDVNTGAAANHNFVFEQARAPYFKWAAHDDECRPELLRRCIEVLEQRRDVVLAYPQAELIDGDGHTVGRYTLSIASDESRPSVRLKRLLDTIGLGTPMYGVIRRDILRQTSLHGAYISADFVLLGELAVLGRIHQVPEPLLRKRFHAARSQEANQTEAEMLAWFDPRTAGDRQLLPEGYRLTANYLLAIGRLPVDRRTRLACGWTVLARRHRGVRFRRALRALVGLPAHSSPR